MAISFWVSPGYVLLAHDEEFVFVVLDLRFELDDLFVFVLFRLDHHAREAVDLVFLVSQLFDQLVLFDPQLLVRLLDVLKLF